MKGHHGRGLPLNQAAALHSGNGADHLKLSGKGRLELGADADLALVEVGSNFVLESEDLIYCQKMSPYVGRTFCGRVARTVVRGRTVFREGEVVSEPVGQLITPSRRADATPNTQQA